MNHYTITIARGYGSRGKTIGEKLAKDLGISFYDREILRMASDESGINEALFGKSDEMLNNSLLFHIVKKVDSKELVSPDSSQFTSEENLFKYSARIIEEIAQKESSVIVGRCADHILKEHKNVIRLYFYASMEDCTKRIMESTGLTEKEAVKKIQKTDKSRAEYYMHFTGKDWNDVKNYDLCLNTFAMSDEKLISVIKDYIENYVS